MKKILLLSVLLLYGFSTIAQSITANTGIGNWDSPGTWVGGNIPGSSNDIIIPSAAKVKVNATGLSISHVTITGTGQLEINNPFTINGGQLQVMEELLQLKMI